MPVVGLGTNITALNAERKLRLATDVVSTASERLSSGLRINQASDDAAGVAVATSLDVSAKVYGQAIRNVNDGISALNIAEQGMAALVNTSQRILELAEQSANGTYSSAQRAVMDLETQAIINEQNRIIETTKFNGITLLDQTTPIASIQSGFGTEESLTLSLQRLRSTFTQGDGTFQTFVTYPVGSSTGSVILADLNGDGNLDRILGIDAGVRKVHVGLGNGDGSFKAPITLDNFGEYPEDVVTADLNGDGKLDIVAGGILTATATVYLGNGDGTFIAPNSFNVGGNAANLSQGHDLVLADLNGDSKLDLISTNGTSDSIGVLLGNGNGTFLAPSTFASAGGRPTAAHAIDLNGDGLLDLAVANYTGNNVSIHLGNGNGTFKAPTTNIFALSPADLIIADFNEDSKLDIFAVGQNNGEQVFLGNGDGTFKIGATPVPFGNTSQGIGGDFNSDGHLDVVLANLSSSKVDIFFGNGNGTFKAPISQAAGGSVYAITSGDVNGDGATDILTDASVALANGRTSTLPFLSYVSSETEGTVTVPQVHSVSILTQASARSTLDTVSNTLNTLELRLSEIGAFRSRLDTTVRTLGIRKEGYTAAAGRIKDADIANETSTLVKGQILQKVASAILSQANIQPRLALDLITS